jgi:antitoxin (DNA-binding transcriptional repressor) of toxin-antitoxin stability system
MVGGVFWPAASAGHRHSSLMKHRLRSAPFVISPDIMNTVTTADLRNHFRRVSAWLDNGESVEILKRGKPYATLLPIAKPTPSRPPRVDFAAQRKAIWKGRRFSAVEVAEMRASELESED